MQLCQVSPETVRRIDLELRKTVAEVADMKKALTKSSRKVESLERGIKQIEKLMEDIRGEQLASWSVADSGEEFPPSATKPLACGDVDLRPQVGHDSYCRVRILLSHKAKVGGGHYVAM